VKFRNVLFTLLGVIGLLLKGRYTGPYRELVHSYGGNITVSFAVYFMLANLQLRCRFRRLATAGLALAAVYLFEVTDGFQVMSNVYDVWDLAGNAAGVALAIAADAATLRESDRGR
jgi:hypothetical protein